MINRNFTFLWLGKIISQLGDKFYAVALAWWILQKTNSPSIMGFFLLASVLPGILLGFFAGALTDRWQRKTMLIVTDIIRGCLVLAISYLSMIDALKIWHVFSIGLGLSLATAFFDPAIQAIIPEIVEKEKLTKANGMSQMVGGICTVAGPLLGALAVSVFGLTLVFFANSISYFVSAFLACFLIIDKVYQEPGEKRSVWKDMHEGVCFIKKQKRIAFVLKIIALAHLFVGSLSVLLPFLANGLEGCGVNNLGYLEAMIGVGLVAGSAFMSVKKKASVDERTLVLFIMTVGFCFIAISVLQFLRIQTVYIYMLIMMVIGTSIAFAAVFWQSLLQNYTPDHMTGRVFSVSTLVGNTSLPLAYGIFGVLLNLSSIYILTAACGACLIGLSSYYIFKANEFR
ncbi:MFS transporter [Sporomusa acidovorans]|uniref:Enterobactin exporter EntS n=1 Tax=Sporomusa acidovorans (strain ATCC 49682 / DSM 3132 / Mol) TaxID=1123286 RepID=A0ABZ3J6T1_SPOA4|nr:MFS transporter [Sporomusa acidovorans]OZC18557.1 putative bacilysin exporter BacE [Sporomusa acidovorans DSM 3132]SDE38281.1 Predicted arabinose efflux permease, MFS family [Sporomusa acidovorans]